MWKWMERRQRREMLVEANGDAGNIPACPPCLQSQSFNPTHGNLMLGKAHVFWYIFPIPLSKGLCHLTSYNTHLEKSCNKNTFFFPYHMSGCSILVPREVSALFIVWHSDNSQTGSSLSGPTAAIMGNGRSLLSIIVSFVLH